MDLGIRIYIPIKVSKMSKSRNRINIDHNELGHQYAHVRQDSQTIAMPVPVAGIEQVSPVTSPGPGEQGNHYPRGQYVGHAEIQDSRF